MSDVPATDPALDLIVNGKAHRLSVGGGQPTVAALIASLDLGAQRVAVEVGGRIVPKAEHASHLLVAGDTVEIVTFVGGG